MVNCTKKAHWRGSWVGPRGRIWSLIAQLLAGPASPYPSLTGIHFRAPPCHVTFPPPLPTLSLPALPPTLSLQDTSPPSSLPAPPPISSLPGGVQGVLESKEFWCVENLQV